MKKSQCDESTCNNTGVYYGTYICRYSHNKNSIRSCFACLIWTWWDLYCTNTHLHTYIHTYLRNLEYDNRVSKAALLCFEELYWFCYCVFPFQQIVFIYPLQHKWSCKGVQPKFHINILTSYSLLDHMSYELMESVCCIPIL